VSEEDITLMTQHLNKVMAESVKNAVCDRVSFRRLQLAVMARLILFNKRRSGEMSRATVEMYANMASGKWKNQKEIDALDAVLKAVAQIFFLDFIKGKICFCHWF
jgi:hypothetical protein